jgi:hypothetical protein
MTFHHQVLTVEEWSRLDRGLCAWCEGEMQRDEVDDHGRITCGSRCRQARHRAKLR